jgi:hypothetical protein
MRSVGLGFKKPEVKPQKEKDIKEEKKEKENK